MNRRKKYGFAILAIVLCLSLVLGGVYLYVKRNRICNKVNRIEFQNKISQTEFEAIAGAHLQKKTDLILASCEKSSNDFKDDTEEAAIVRFREKMAVSGETYSRSRTTLNILQQEIKADGRLHVLATENTYLMMVEAGFETGHSKKHNVIYENKGGKWALVADEQLDPSALMPLEEAYKFMKKEYRGKYEEWFGKTNGNASNLVFEKGASINRPSKPSLPRAVRDYIERATKSTEPNYKKIAEK